MAKDTKERILMAALDMFSKKGYEGTNIRELAASLELVKSGIYKHYESKEAIWNALLDRMIAYYGEHFGSAEHLPPVPDSLEDFVSMTMRMVNITIHDEQIVKTRKVLTLEQYRDVRARDLATKHFLTGLEEGAHPGAVPGRARAGPGDKALPDRADGDVHTHLLRYDGQGIAEKG